MFTFDKEFVMYLSKYIGENNYTAKKYLNAFHLKFKDILNLDDENLTTNKAYRLWNFNDKEILEFIYGKQIKINESGFLSYFSNIGNTKYMIDFLGLNNHKKLFYIIEKNESQFLNIYQPLKNINEDEYGEEDLNYLEEVLDTYQKENEYVRLDIPEYHLNYNNVKSIMIHEWLGDLLEIKGMHKLNNGYYYATVDKSFILKLREEPVLLYLVENSYLVDSKGCSLLDEFYDIRYDEYLKEIEEEENPVEEEEDSSPISIKFKSSD